MLRGSFNVYDIVAYTSSIAENQELEEKILAATEKAKEAESMLDDAMELADTEEKRATAATAELATVKSSLAKQTEVQYINHK